MAYISELDEDDLHYLEEEGGEDDAKKTWNEIFWCGHWNGVPVNKIFIEQNTIEPKVKAYVPTYEPLEVIKCKKCGELWQTEKNKVISTLIKMQDYS